MSTYPASVLAAAREFVFSPFNFSFSPIELRVINPFFSNPDRRVFFMHSLPTNIGATLLAMFSRLKNPRGLRGVWVDTFLPQLLATQLPEVEIAFGGDEVAFLKHHGITNLNAFGRRSGDDRVFTNFVNGMCRDPDYVRTFAESKKTRKFLTTWLDKYGHNSIARMGSLWVCFEGISLLAAKSLEWTRPGAGYIELSTRYVDMSAKGCYPVERELEAGWGMEPAKIREMTEQSFRFYQDLAGNNFDGPFPAFLRSRFGPFYADAPKDLEAGVIGETCDVLGNFLPAHTLTSVGVAVSGESFPSILKHLLLDDTPENHALVELILEEAPKIGAHQFARHFEPTPWVHAQWAYRPTAEFLLLHPEEGLPFVLLFQKRIDTDVLEGLLRDDHLSAHDRSFSASFLKSRRFTPDRALHDKLPAEFEAVSATFKGVMSFRGWRDLHRQGYCTHFRTYLTPDIGFYRYDKPAPPELSVGFRTIHEGNLRLDALLRERGVPPSLRQYPLALGNLVGFIVAANLRQWEFCNWQRTKPDVNHEVRQVFLAIENTIRKFVPWWSKVSRANTYPAYIFARGNKAVPLPHE